MNTEYTQKKKILIIDDEPDFTEMVKLNLERTGMYVVSIVNNPAEATFKALGFQPDLVLLDVIMPEVEGPDIVNEFKKQELLKNIPVVFFTATVKQSELTEVDGKIGGHEFLAKPGSVEELIECIEKNLR